MESNRILPILGAVVLLMLMFIGVRSCTSDNQTTVGLSEIPKAGTPDADSPADTIRTLTAEVAALKSENQKIQQQNKELLRQRQDIATQVKNELMAQVRQETKDLQSSEVSGLTQQMEYLKTRLSELTQIQNQAATQQAGDIPIGFGLSGQEQITGGQPDVIWVDPLGTEKDKEGKPVYIPSVSANGEGGLLSQAAQQARQTEKYLSQELNKLDEEPNRPVYTVPRNATLIGSTGMTALIGRIPRNGVVEDPFPFKVIVGKDNLAANGIEMPGLDGMIFSGKSTGDWTLSCVRGKVISVTYVFDDGTIRTLSADLQNQSQGQGQATLKIPQSTGSSSGQNQRYLGWISDRRGIPCVTGRRITNAPTYLAGRILASGAEAAAGAFAQSQTTNTVSAVQGVTTSVITGDTGKYAMSKALSGSAKEISDYLRERAAQSFDAIYVDTGAELAIHIDVELPIDYEPNGRKTRYAYFDDENDSDDYLD